MIALPPWLPEATWTAFIAMRKQIKKPATDFAQLLILKELYKIRDLGHDPVTALEQSIVKCWSDVWPAKDKGITAAAATDYQATKARNEAEDAREFRVDPEIAKAARAASQALKRNRTLQ